MIKLDYQTNNPRWGWSGIEYTSWENYAYALGYLANECHYHNRYSGRNALIEVHFEGNDVQGAWGKEGRIQYYGQLAYLATHFPDWDTNKSSGTRDVTCRMNSNDYIYSLIYDYSFTIVSKPGYTTRDIFPPNVNPYNTVLDKLVGSLPRNCDAEAVEVAFDAGWNL